VIDGIYARNMPSRIDLRALAMQFYVEDTSPIGSFCFPADAYFLLIVEKCGSWSDSP
jgi:hypothetical protein